MYDLVSLFFFHLDSVPAADVEDDQFEDAEMEEGEDNQ